jgi:hypothetical protein
MVDPDRARVVQATDGDTVIVCGHCSFSRTFQKEINISCANFFYQFSESCIILVMHGLGNLRNSTNY